MNLLFRLSQDIEGFENIKSTKDFFSNILPERDKNYFFNTKKFSKDKIGKDEIIYFAYDGYIVAKANYLGKIKTIPNRFNSKYIHGHKLNNIEIINSELRLNLSEFKILFSMKYVDSSQLQDEINRVISQKLVEIYPDGIENDDLFEGAKKQIKVNAYERNPQARKKCIEYYGTKCSVCNFDFEKIFGEIGKGFIHVHHVKPLSEVNEEYKINPIQDLRPVCPNCHAMIHSKKPAYKIKDIKKLIE